MSFWLAMFLLLVAALAFFARSDIDLVRGLKADGDLLWGLDAQELAALTTGLAFALLLLPGLFGAYHGRVRRAVRDVFGWAAIGIVAVGLYNFRDELGQIAFRIAGEFAPPGTATHVEQGPGGERSVRIRRRNDGHFTASVAVNGASVSMLVDTGASTVVLRQADAKKLGIDLTGLKYTVPVQTANGIAYAAHARLKNVTIGSIEVANIEALVAQPGVLKESLLGMTFLSRLRSYEFSGQYLTFRN